MKEQVLLFHEALRLTQEHITKNYAIVLRNNPQDNRELILSYINAFLENQNIRVEDMSEEDLEERIYGEMTGFSILSKYLSRKDIEEININQWNDIKVIYENGDVLPMKEKFNSPTHALDVMKRMLHHSGMILDMACPIAVGHFANNIRVTVVGEGVIDKEKGLAASIRLVNPKAMKEEDFISYGTATKEILNFLTTIYDCGISLCITGATGSGKTTLASFIAETLPNENRLISIEQGTREMELTKVVDGDVVNNVIHMTTRFSDDPTQHIGMDKLLETALTMNPSHIFVGEMKSTEAFNAIMAANTGHGVLTTTHANSCFDTYHRMATLSKQKYDMDDVTLIDLASKAFPVVVFTKKLKDNSRRIMEITECVGSKDTTPILRTLWKFEIKGQEKINGKSVFKGEYVKVNEISDIFRNKLIANGVIGEFGEEKEE